MTYEGAKKIKSEMANQSTFNLTKATKIHGGVRLDVNLEGARIAQEAGALTSMIKNAGMFLLTSGNFNC